MIKITIKITIGAKRLLYTFVPLCLCAFLYRCN